MLYWPISGSASHLRPPHSSSSSTLACGQGWTILLWLWSRGAVVCDGFVFYHGRLSFWGRLDRIGWVPPWTVAALCSFFQSMERTVGYQLHQCPRSEQDSTDTCTACTVAILARALVTKNTGHLCCNELRKLLSNCFLLDLYCSACEEKKLCICLFTTSRKMHKLCSLQVFPHHRKGGGSLAGFCHNASVFFKLFLCKAFQNFSEHLVTYIEWFRLHSDVSKFFLKLCTPERVNGWWRARDPRLGASPGCFWT